jgi:hypothetical protein
MSEDRGRSAPEQVDALQPIWAALSSERLTALGCKWVDLSVRSHLPQAFEKVGHQGVGAVLRTLPPIVSPDTLRFAFEQLMEMKTPDEPVEPLAAFFSVAASLKELVEEFQIYRCCFLTVMTSRLVFGDDRVVQTMMADLLAAADGQ